ncbi:hypothetical protein ACQEVZ_33175 [Dactylosporangium sp. CA-152071]|uniref:hypothetical protein n=1 Tax=Dactylosporangium sp. CA-152071 TaxID=3239933 RepID=UPI003D8D30B1
MSDFGLQSDFGVDFDPGDLGVSDFADPHAVFGEEHGVEAGLSPASETTADPGTEESDSDSAAAAAGSQTPPSTEGLETASYDSDGDGVADVLVADENHDGVTDIAMWDTNDDGLIDQVAYDQDHDGKIDLIYHDDDFDGEVDRVESADGSQDVPGYTSN